MLNRRDLNFLLTNRIPRRYATLLMGRVSRIRSHRFTRASIAAWRLFAPDLDLSEAKQREFATLQECFTRELLPGSRPIDPRPTVATSPADAIVGACGRVERGMVIQAKGFPYSLAELLHDDELVAKHEGGSFVTLRLKSSFYHRFHAPCGGRLRRVVYISGDTWNVNPIALERIERLFCKNERVVLDLEIGEQGLTLVPIAAILVASIKLHCLDAPLDLRYRGASEIACDARFHKGDELGYFQNGSTIVCFASGGLTLADNVKEGATIRVGQPLFTNLGGPHANVSRQAQRAALR